MTEPASPERTFTKKNRSGSRSIQIAPGNRLSVSALLVRTFRFPEIFIEQGWRSEQWVHPIDRSSENALKPAASSNLWRPLRLPTFRNLLITRLGKSASTCHFHFGLSGKWANRKLSVSWRCSEERESAGTVNFVLRPDSLLIPTQT